MAIYHLHVQSISRRTGRSAPGAAAYRAGERIRDERTGVLHTHSGRRDVSHKEILLPTELDTVAMDWARDRSKLWNAAEAAERRRDARVAREYEVALPAELSAPQRLQLARAFAAELANRHQVAIDLAVHEPRPAGDARNYHAHLLSTTRQLGAQGFGAKTGLDMHDSMRERLGLTPSIVEFNSIRERWAALTNEALQAAGLGTRVDHRSHWERGLDQEPTPHIPYAAVQAERRGLRSEFAEQIRERYRMRVEERQRLREQHAQAPAIQSPEQLRRQAQQAWLQLRSASSRANETQLEGGAEQEHAL